MNNSNSSLIRLARGLTALFALGCALSLGSQTAKATDELSLQALSDQDAKLPVAVSFAKEAKGEGLYAMTVKNDGKAALKLNVKVLLSVVHHAMDKARVEPEHELAPGASWTVDGLAAQDRVILSAEGFAALELTVPHGTK